jgi:hypothetical protein
VNNQLTLQLLGACLKIFKRCFFGVALVAALFLLESFLPLQLF